MADNSKIYVFLTGKFEEKEGQTRFEVLAITQDGNKIVDDWGANKEDAMAMIGVVADSDNQMANAAVFEATYPDGYDLEWVDLGNLEEKDLTWEAIRKMEKKAEGGDEPGQPVQRMDKMVLSLPCPVPDHDVAEFGRRLAEMLSMIDAAHEELKNSTKQAKGEIADLEKRAFRLRQAVTEQVIHEDVECRVDYNWDSGYKEVYRKDTGEFVKSIEIGPEETQEAMKMDDKGEAKAAAETEAEPQEDAENGSNRGTNDSDANGMGVEPGADVGGDTKGN